MASSTASIPRFLLPQSGQIWRRAGPNRTSTFSSVSSASGPVSASASAAASRRIWARLASNKPTGSSSSSSDPRVLAKPERFNPPSHGSRLPKKTPPRHYGGDITADEAFAQARREYPGMPPPKTSRAHWFLNNRWIHVVITVGTLSGLAIWTFALSFRHTSPFADMLPAAGDYVRHPITSLRTLIEVLRLHERHKTARVEEKRRRNVEDVAKRAAYRKAHGLPEEMGLFNQPMAKIRADGEGEEQKGEGAAAVGAAAAEGYQQEGVEEGSPVAAEASKQEGEHGARRLSEEEREAAVKQAKGKWLGIF